MTHLPTFPTSLIAECQVAVVMGSDSDLPVMSGAVDVLAELGIPTEVRVVSAHRSPTDMLSYGQRARDRGIAVIVAGAGGAAHLPGMLAAVTTVPVIGVPVGLRALGGIDSLLSMAQMPAGVPVATVGIDGSRNAGLLAARILGLGDETVAGRLRDHQEGLAATASAADERVRASVRARGQVASGSPAS